MAEKKTFKNPYHISHSSDWIEVYQLENTEIPSFSGNEDEWDMEVTFTKKQPKPEVGGTCKYNGKAFTIVAVDEHLVWIRPFYRTAAEVPGYLQDVDALTDVKPWQPV